MTSAQLAAELEVARRTILRDLDALTEAGLPVIVHQGYGGGIELAFDYRTRLTGLDADEAEAMGVMLSRAPDHLRDLGLGEPAARAAAKVWEAFPDQTRAAMAMGRDRFVLRRADAGAPDPRRTALAMAVRERRIVRLRAASPEPQVVHPIALILDAVGWAVVSAPDPANPVPESAWGDINISSRCFR